MSVGLCLSVCESRLSMDLYLSLGLSVSVDLSVSLVNNRGVDLSLWSCL